MASLSLLARFLLLSFDIGACGCDVLLEIQNHLQSFDALLKSGQTFERGLLLSLRLGYRTESPDRWSDDGLHNCAIDDHGTWLCWWTWVHKEEIQSCATFIFKIRQAGVACCYARRVDCSWSVCG
jgi:hypothetical protein